MVSATGLLATGLIVGLGTASYYARPKNIIMHSADAKITAISPRLERNGLMPRLSLDLALKMNALIENPNVVDVKHLCTTLAIYYRGDAVGKSEVPQDDLPARSCREFIFDGTIDAARMVTTHGRDLVSDIANRDLDFVATTTSVGDVTIFGITSRVTVEGRNVITIDPMSMDVKEFDSKALLILLETPLGSEAQFEQSVQLSDSVEKAPKPRAIRNK